MIEPTPTIGQLRAAGVELRVDRIRVDFEATLSPSARAVWDFAAAMHDLETSPGVTAEECEQLMAGILALAGVAEASVEDEESVS